MSAQDGARVADDARAEPADRLRALAEHLDPGLARHLRALLVADSDARKYQEMAARAQRAEDLVAEFRRQREPLQRALDRVKEENRELRQRYDVPWGPLTPKTLRERVDGPRAPILPAPPPPPPAPRIHG